MLWIRFLCVSPGVTSALNEHYSFSLLSPTLSSISLSSQTCNELHPGIFCFVSFFSSHLLFFCLPPARKGVTEYPIFYIICLSNISDIDSLSPLTSISKFSTSAVLHFWWERVGNRICFKLKESFGQRSQVVNNRKKIATWDILLDRVRIYLQVSKYFVSLISCAVSIIRRKIADVPSIGTSTIMLANTYFVVSVCINVDFDATKDCLRSETFMNNRSVFISSFIIAFHFSKQTIHYQLVMTSLTAETLL